MAADHKAALSAPLHNGNKRIVANKLFDKRDDDNIHEYIYNTKQYNVKCAIFFFKIYRYGFEIFKNYGMSVIQI